MVHYEKICPNKSTYIEFYGYNIYVLTINKERHFSLKYFFTLKHCVYSGSRQISLDLIFMTHK